ncbi:MAG: hypothetical protein KF889_15740 [Alphaproteobacteria bacterium]|nr:hypothetical protein [Alphaproteobacteria bacterium]MCW5740178.1 hypothetical protein [Alphaproteobacteria bacterium]
MAGRIWIPPYKPLGVSTQGVPGGGYLAIDAIAGQFGPSPQLQFGLQAAEGAAGVATVLSEHLAGDNEAIVKGADARLGETEQSLLFDPQTGYLNLQGQDALTKAPAVIDAYREAQAREMATMVDDDQRQMLRDLSERRLASFSTQVERHTEAERIRWYDEAGERRIAQMQADARLHWSDDALLRRALGTTRAEVNEQAERHHWDSALTEATLRRQTSHTLVAAIEAAVERDPGRAKDLRTRYAAHIEDQDRAALDALLAEAQTREHTRQARAKILNATPPDGEPSVSQWRLRQAEAIVDPAVRAATIRTLHSVAAADEARARTLAEQVLARVLKDGLTDPAQIPVRDWVALDADHRQAIETRLDHNAAGTEPAPNAALVDLLATQMTQAPYDFARRDLVPLVAQLALPQWQRFRDWQAGLRRNDSATVDNVYAIKRGLQIAEKLLSPSTPAESVADWRAALVEEIDTWRRINAKSPHDLAIAEMIARPLTAGFHDIPNPRTGSPRLQLVQNRDRDKAGRPTLPSVQSRPPAGGGGPDPWEKPAIPPLPAPLGALGQPKSSPTKPATPPATKAPSASSSQPGPSPRSPTQKAPATFSPTGTAAGRTIGEASRGSPNFRPFKPGGHHIIPKEVYKSLGLSDRALKVFERATTGPLKPRSHTYNTQHRVYNDVVAEVVNDWMKRKGIKADSMTEAEANELLDYIMTHEHPEIRAYLKYLNNNRQ